MGERDEKRVAYDKFRKTLRDNGMKPKEADRTAREVAERHDRRTSNR